MITVVKIIKPLLHDENIHHENHHTVLIMLGGFILNYQTRLHSDYFHDENHHENKNYAMERAHDRRGV
jgi:hypothetical protein